jgi:hypothetical protein
MATGLYPGKGQPLYLANSSFPQEPSFPLNAVIPDSASSIGMPLNAGLTTSINVLFNAIPSGTAFNVMYDIVPTFANEYVLSAVAAVGGQSLYVWSTDGLIELDGFVRITNDGGENIDGAWLQQRAAMVG